MGKVTFRPVKEAFVSVQEAFWMEKEALRLGKLHFRGRTYG